MLSEMAMKKILKSMLLLILAALVFNAGAENKEEKPEFPVQDSETAKGSNVESTGKDYEPAGRFVPSEKLRADDAISFPVDI